MTALTPAGVARTLAPHAATIGFPLDEATVIGWMIALKDALVADGIPPVTQEELSAAVARHMRDSRFRMTPADAWTLIRARRREQIIGSEVAHEQRAITREAGR